ncbi:mechanosensitive ion channel domain-containing protein [Pleurocapsa sp. PCC 7319]|uniref:mechanosensitive ion channel family protein n=1 Tax=Pleurocapsa sp. PCC 7319 TaxID=118161 RepID=UPI0003601A93
MNFDFLSIEFLNNQINDYILAFTTLIGGIVSMRIIRTIALKNLKKWAAKTDNIYNDKLILILERNLVPIIYIAIVYLSVNNLSLHSILDHLIEVLAIIVATILIVRLFTNSVEYIIKLYWVTYHRENINIEQSINALIPAIRVLIWLIGIIFILDNLGFDISAVVTSLGIGGVAIALASQGVLQDLFSYFSILFDRPFELGDFIVVGDYLGTVEYVGIKTTRLKSIDGEEIIIANTDLTGSRIRNFKRMRQRRIVFKFGVVYETSTELLAKIPILIEEIINSTENTTCDRAHFSGYGEFSLDFEVVYFVHNNDYTIYMNAQQKINLKIKSEFAKYNIDFAYPTQINYLSNLSLNSNNNGNEDKTLKVHS